MNAPNTLIVTLPGDTHIAVPADLSCLTTYVLHEQSDWLEDEIRFLRRFIEPGMRMIDIGANYGVYALTCAAAVGATGHVWAFEPAAETARYLRRSIDANRFTHLTLVEAALSDREGHAQLFTSQRSDLNSLSLSASNRDAHTAQSETVTLTTLDLCADRLGWSEIDFIKLDAEGEEAKIISAGRATLSNNSPLIMFELKHGDQLNQSLIASFEHYGYRCYRLVPALDVLVPFDPHAIDSYALNLFCCRVDRAKRLSDRGLLVETNDSISTAADISIASFDALAMEYRRTMDANETMVERVAVLSRLITRVRTLYKPGQLSAEILALCARIALDYGERGLGVTMLEEFLRRFAGNAPKEIHPEAIPAHTRYETVTPHGTRGEWLVASVIERYIETHAFSTYFTRDSMLPWFRRLNDLNYLDETMHRRMHLMQACFAPARAGL